MYNKDNIAGLKITTGDGMDYTIGTPNIENGTNTVKVHWTFKGKEESLAYPVSQVVAYLNYKTWKVIE